MSVPPNIVSTFGVHWNKVSLPITNDLQGVAATRDLVIVTGGNGTIMTSGIVITALKLLKDVEHRGDVRVIQTAVRELRYAFKMFAPSRARWTKASFTSSYFLTRRSFTSINSTGCSIAAPDSTKHSDRI